MGLQVLHGAFVWYSRFGQVTLHLWMSCRLAETGEKEEEEEDL